MDARNTELFVINRFTGEEQEQSSVSSNSILKKLHERAQERKKQRLSADSNSLRSDQNDQKQRRSKDESSFSHDEKKEWNKKQKRNKGGASQDESSEQLKEGESVLRFRFKESKDGESGISEDGRKMKKKRKKKEKLSGIHLESVEGLGEGGGVEDARSSSQDNESSSRDEDVRDEVTPRKKKKKKGLEINQKHDDGAMEENADLLKGLGGGIDQSEEQNLDAVEDGEVASAMEDKRSDIGETKDEMFPVLGNFKSSKKEKVRRVLPDWLSHPSVISQDVEDTVTVTSLPGIDPNLVQLLKENNITQFFPVQWRVIPLILQSVEHGILTGPAGFRPRDLCVSAPTGSGKTLAFAVPIVQALLHRIVMKTRALVVLPTKDLATQVYKVFLSLCQRSNLKVILIGGQKTLQQEQGMLVKKSFSGHLECGSDIIVATPGRLMDHINWTKGFTLKHLRFLVIDEADRMMDQLSKDWISRVEKAVYEDERLPPGPFTVASELKMALPFQKLLFSATLSQNPEKLTHLNLFNPQLVTSVVDSKKKREGADADDVSGDFIGKYSTPTGLKEFFVTCSAGEKPLVVAHLIKNLGCSQVLCFTNSVESTHRLYLLLKAMGCEQVAEFSSRLSTYQRQRMLKEFKEEKIQLLICSDAMARGMDVPNVKFVISYDFPPYLKTYIHRVGRTARAGRQGTAYALLLQREVQKFKNMTKTAGKTGIQKLNIKPADLELLMTDYDDALAQLPAIIKDEKQQHQHR